ncbi:hypothetical protein FPSE_10862 [Fusarium pseudograminearum CS3096]|uniref:HNH nuclease domain-containing protein n=1 Tax=Fusarium pseudograminearum (strain CS3096) TaxID=1028729 RepID=K3V6H2_FUSPC|nr:hypothetical protein FPSE_10862 [Fusarium pseudograminearum CS3096]EKJ68937.1 hypothetical protein FPSE_10862 [Fusarium pseudograminearum CS3096]
MNKDTSSLQKAFEARMVKQYCPDPPTPGYLWDPILHVWHSPDSGQIKASHLFPSRQANFMNSIFGRDAREELFSPSNGLFLHPLIEKALHCGYMAIVPDVDFNERLPWWNWNNLSQSIEVCGWEKLEVKNYKVIVLSDRTKRIRSLFAHQGSQLLKTWWSRDGQKLVFQNDYRPQARYVWWTYLNTILHMVWRCEEGVTRNGCMYLMDLERAAQYWRTYGRYAKRSQILGLIEHIRYDHAHGLLNQGYEEDDGIEDARPEAAEALLLEVIARSEEDGDDDFGADNGDDDDDYYDFNDYEYDCERGYDCRPFPRYSSGLVRN